MNKKFLYPLLGIILVILIGVGIFMITSKEAKTNNVDNNINENSTNNNMEEISSDSDILVLYFSATGNTKVIAEYIASDVNGELVEIIPLHEYTDEDLNYNVSDSRANLEQNNDSARPEIANMINIDDYETIFVGYPIWWGDVPKIILTLLDTYNFDGKTVIPFCTSGGSSILESQTTLENYNKNINWITGKRFSTSTSRNEITSWLEELNIN